MIQWKKAPAGFICQYFADELDPPLPNGYRARSFLFVTGQWSPTLAEAIQSVRDEKPKALKKLMRKREAIMAKLKDLDADIDRLRSADDILKEKD